MPANFLHGVETVELTKGTTTVRTVKTAIIGLVGTAPINDVDAEYKSINEPILITKEEDATLYFGKHKAGFTIPQALKAIFDQGAGTIMVVNVFDPSVHESPEDVELKDIVGSVETLTGKRTGLRAFEDSYSLFGFYPKTIIAPVYSEDQVIVDEINKVCKKIRAIGIVDAPVGTTVQDAIKGRGTSKINFNINSDRVVLCYPHIKVYDYDAQEIKLEPLSQRLAGVIAVKDNEKGYHWSPSNTVIQGVLGTEKNLTSMINDPQSEVNLLNEAGILTVFNSYEQDLELGEIGLQLTHQVH